MDEHFEHLPEASARRAATGTQAIRRASLLVRLIASRSRSGLRLADIVRSSGLEHATAHRILKGLMAEGLVMQDRDSRRYLLGPLIFELGLAAAPHFNLAEICRPSLQRIADRTADTVFLIVRSGLDSVCIERREGSFPVKALTLDVGARRPLGVGAGGLALLMPLPDDAVDEVLAANAARLGAFGGLDAALVRQALGRSRQLGYAVNDRTESTGATTLGLPVVNRYDQPFAAVSVCAISSRMKEDRRSELVSLLRSEILLLEKAVREASRL